MSNEIKKLEDAINGVLGAKPQIPLSTNVKDPAITSQFGKRELNGKEDFHPGIDLGLSEGSRVFAVDGGKVSVAGWQNANDPHAGAGLYIKIMHDKGKESLYMHLSKLAVAAGDIVKAGQLIGYSGKTGMVAGRTGEHLHLELRQNGTARAPTQNEVAIAIRGTGA